MYKVILEFWELDLSYLCILQGPIKIERIADDPDHLEAGQVERAGFAVKLGRVIDLQPVAVRPA